MRLFTQTKTHGNDEVDNLINLKFPINIKLSTQKLVRKIIIYTVNTGLAAVLMSVMDLVMVRLDSVPMPRTIGLTSV